MRIKLGFTSFSSLCLLLHISFKYVRFFVLQVYLFISFFAACSCLFYMLSCMYIRICHRSIAHSIMRSSVSSPPLSRAFFRISVMVSTCSLLIFTERSLFTSMSIALVLSSNLLLSTLSCKFCKHASYVGANLSTKSLTCASVKPPLFFLSCSWRHSYAHLNRRL